MIVPCEQCLLIPICRNKTISNIMNDCPLTYNFMMETGSQSKGFRKKYRGILFNTLKPKKWKLSIDGYVVIPQKESPKREETQLWVTQKDKGLKPL